MNRKKMSIVKIEDLRDAWSAYPIHLKDFDRKVRKEFKGRWKPWLNKWIHIVDKNNRLTYEIRLVQQTDEKLYPEVAGEKILINLHAGILFFALKNLIVQSKEIIDQSVIIKSRQRRSHCRSFLFIKNLLKLRHVAY